MMPRTLNEIADDIEQIEKSQRKTAALVIQATARSHGQLLPDDMFSEDMPMIIVLEDGRRLELRDMVAELRELSDAS